MCATDAGGRPTRGRGDRPALATRELPLSEGSEPLRVKHNQPVRDLVS